MSYPDRSTRNPTPIYNPYARKLPSPSDRNPNALDSDDDNDYDSNNEEQTFSAYYKPKPRASAYGDVDGYYSDDMDDCSSNCSAHDVTEEEVINWMIEDNKMQEPEPVIEAPVRRSARIARRVQKFGPTSYVEMNSGVRKAKVEKNKNVPVVEQKPVVDEAPVRRSARIARRAQKYGPTSYVGMDSVEPEGEGDFITDIWYDYSVHYDSDYESPEQIKERKEKEKQAKRDAWWQRFFERRRAKHAEEQAKEARKAMKKELAKAKKANEQMDIVEDIAKLTLDPSNEEYYQMIVDKQTNNVMLTWPELNFVTDYAISQMKQEIAQLPPPPVKEEKKVVRKVVRLRKVV